MPTLVKDETGYLTNVMDISAGTKSSMAVTYNGEGYVFGENTNKKLGIEDEKINYAKEITKLQDKNGNELDLAKLEIVSTGKTHSVIADIDGFVYTSGLNENGELGTEDNENREIFTKIGRTEIMTDPKEINIPVNTSQDISIFLGYTFNLKSDVASETELDVASTNEKEAVINKKQDVNNAGITNLKEFTPNYTIYGNKIGRVDLTLQGENKYLKNLWINVVNEAGVDVSSKVVNGQGFTVSLRSNGEIYTFGNINGKNSPEKIDMPEKVIDIAAGRSHIIILGKSGTVYSYGENGSGQLGTGNTATAKLATKINLEGIEKVEASGNTSYAIDGSGKVYAFGEGYSKLPTAIEKDKNIIDISKNYYLSSDGKVYRISDDEQIMLSYNEYEPWEDPVYVEDKVMQISEGTDHLLLLGKTGNVYSYGQNVYGQLGDNETIPREECITTVVKVKDDGGNLVKLENVAEISAGDKYGIAVTNTGKVYTFGINRHQTLGISNELNAGGIEESHIAILKEDIQDVERVTAGYVHTAVYKENGNVYTWGNGKDGSLGNAENFDYYIPQLVGKDIIQTNTPGLVLKKGEYFDIKAWISYFNLFVEKTATLKYEIIDNDIAMIDENSGTMLAQATRKNNRHRKRSRNRQNSSHTSRCHRKQ